MKNINNEKDLEFYYRNFFEKHLGVETTAINNTDGVFEYKGTKVLIEIKFKVPFNKENISRTLAQAIYYCKRFESNLDTVPSVIFIGNENEFVYFDYDEYCMFIRDDAIDWYIPPSKVFQSKDSVLVKKIKNSFKQYKTTHITDLPEFIKYIKEYSKEIKSKIVISKDSFVEFFKKFKGLFRNSNNQMLSQVFFTYLLDRSKITKSDNKVVIGSHITNLSWRKVTNFFNNYDTSRLKKEDIVAFYDLFKIHQDRILSGSFYTPPYIARIAIESMRTYIDKDFMEKYVIWDPACGTGNLTKDFEFKHLYLSTVDDLELKLMEYAGVNPNAVRFKYNFVSELDVSFVYQNGFESLRKALEKGNLIFYLNPPFVGLSGTGFEMKQKRDSWTQNIVYNRLKKSIKVMKCDASMLFLYKIMKIAEKAKRNVYVCFFHDASLFLKSSRECFAKVFFKNFKHIYSLLFNSEDFRITEGWEVQFSIFKYEPSKKQREIMFTGHKIFFNELKDIDKVVKYGIRYEKKNKFEINEHQTPLILANKFKKNIPTKTFLFGLGDYADNLRSHNNQNYVCLNYMAFVCNCKYYWKSMIYCGVTSYYVYPNSPIRTRRGNTLNLVIDDRKKFIEHVLDCTVLTIFDKTSLEPVRNSKEINLKTRLKEVGWNGTFRRRGIYWDFINHMFPWNTNAVRKKATKYKFDLVKQDCILNYGDRYTYSKLKKFEKYLSNEARRVLMRAARVYLRLMKNHDEEFFKNGFDNVKLKKHDDKLKELLSKLGKKVYEDSQKFKTLI